MLQDRLHVYPGQVLHCESESLVHQPEHVVHEQDVGPPVQIDSLILPLHRDALYLKQLGLWDRRKDIARNLSGGMKRRLMIARALVNEPQLLILDEPTAGVDIELRRSMWTFLQQINERGTTIILTTHYLEEAEALCRRIAIIDRGRIVEDASTKQLLRRLHVESFILDLTEPITAAPEIDNYTFDFVDEMTLEVQAVFGRMEDLVTLRIIADRAVAQRRCARPLRRGRCTRVGELRVQESSPARQPGRQVAR